MSDFLNIKFDVYKTKLLYSNVKVDPYLKIILVDQSFEISNIFNYNKLKTLFW